MYLLPPQEKCESGCLPGVNLIQCAMDADEAKLKQTDALLANTDALLAKLRAALNLELVEGLPEQVDGFNPNGWMLFRMRSDPLASGPSEYVSVRRETGHVFFLGPLGK
jgi:hypothetical protein